MVLLNLLLYRNSFCGIFRQASVLKSFVSICKLQGGINLQRVTLKKAALSCDMLFPPGTWVTSPPLLMNIDTSSAAVLSPCTYFLLWIIINIKKKSIIHYKNGLFPPGSHTWEYLHRRRFPCGFPAMTCEGWDGAGLPFVSLYLQLGAT